MLFSYPIWRVDNQKAVTQRHVLLIQLGLNKSNGNTEGTWTINNDRPLEHNTMLV